MPKRMTKKVMTAIRAVLPSGRWKAKPAASSVAARQGIVNNSKNRLPLRSMWPYAGHANLGCGVQEMGVV